MVNSGVGVTKYRCESCDFAVYMLCHEVMPTELRAQGVSISRSIGHLVKIFANYVAFEV